MRSFGITDSRPLAGLRGFVFGAGPLGLFTSLALARNGAQIMIASADPIEKGIGFVNAAGLFEPVASADPRAARYLMRGLGFCDWAQADLDWGIEPRRVLFLSDSEMKVEQEWMVQLASYRRATSDELVADRPYGAWFDTFVLQPNIAITAIRRELRRSNVPGVKTIKVTSARMAAKKAFDAGADFFVLALGLGLAEIADIEHVAGANAMLSAGVGVTIVFAIEGLDLRHVIMDDVDFGYLIPQRSQVIGGGTNYLHFHDDPEAQANEPSVEDVALVREKVERLWPDTAGLPGEPRVGSRPLRSSGHLLTATLEPPHVQIPGLALGGAGGSGWTFAVGIADDAAAEIAQWFDAGDTFPLIGPPLDPVTEADASA